MGGAPPASCDASNKSEGDRCVARRVVSHEICSLQGLFRGRKRTDSPVKWDLGVVFGICIAFPEGKKTKQGDGKKSKKEVGGKATKKNWSARQSPAEHLFFSPLALTAWPACGGADWFITGSMHASHGLAAAGSNADGTAIAWGHPCRRPCRHHDRVPDYQ